MKNNNKENIEEMEFKKVGIEYLEILVDLRMEFIKDIHPKIDLQLLEKIRKGTLTYFNDLFKNNAYIGFVGINNNGELICTAGLLIYYLPPLNNENSRKIGHVLNFYTKPAYRKRGIGLKLMNCLKDTAANEKINRLVLNSTKMGFSMYKKAGFLEPEDKAMILDLCSSV
jgi:ribosomal protein S18 acetylase RimI-like enzyme